MALAVISVYSKFNPDFLMLLHGIFASCQYFGDDALVVVDVSCIESVVAIVRLRTF
jgi:hypothetical protein